MQSLSHSIPRCVTAQSFLDSLSRNNDNSSTVTTNPSSLEDDDRNTDIDEQYQELIHTNGPQGSRLCHERRSSMNRSFQHSDMEGGVPVPERISNRQYARVEDELIREGRHYHPYGHQEVLHHLQRPSVHFQQQQHNHYSSGANQYLSSAEYSHYQQQYQQQQPQPSYQRQNQKQQEQKLPSPSSESGAYHHQQHQHIHKIHQSQCRLQQQLYHSHAEMRRLEAMYPPLHDSPEDEGEQCKDALSSSVDHIALEQMLQKPLISRARQQRLLPPPIVIPKDTQRPPSDQQPRTHEQKRPLHPLPSPPSSTPSPESPSSLAIHLFVHHHHHHHSPESKKTSPDSSHNDSSSTPSPVSSTASSSSSSTYMGDPSAHPPPSPPKALLSPLQLPVESTLDQLSKKKVHSNPTPVNTASTLPSPLLSPAPDLIPSTAPLISPRPIAPLLPSLSIPSSRHVHSVSVPASISPPLITPEEDNNSSTSQLPWFNHPQSLANASCNSNSYSSSLPQLQQLQQQQVPPRRHRHYRPTQQKQQLPDPVLSQQLLSTISSQDLARLYVHAAHHLHSHQPIRNYVLMKMIMTQAELAQFGRLRAEMPRAPGPSTGAKPRQKIGFGTKANTGLESRPKIPSKLGIFVSTIEYPDHHQHANHRYQEQQKQQHHQRHSSLSSLSDKDENNEDSYENQKKSTKTRLSMPWTQSLSSLMSLSTNVLSQKKNKKSTTRKINKTSPLSLTFTWTTTQQQQQLQQQGEEEEEEQRQKYPRRSRSWYGTPSTCRRLDELELGESAMEEDNDVEEEDDEDEEQKEEEVEDEHKEEEAQVDWTALRRENNRSQRSTTHSPASVDLRLQLQQQQHQQQQQAKEERYEMMRSYPYKEYSLQQKQQQQQHRQQKTFAHQQTAFPSPVIIGKIVGTNKSKNARRRSGASTSTSSTYLSSPHMLSQSETSSSTHSVMPSLSSSSSSPWFLGSTWPFTETSGYSGFLMLSVFFCILYLFEGTNHFYNLQSALLSIVL